MPDAKDKLPGYSDELIQGALQFISDPTERAVKAELLRGFGTTMLVLDGAGMDPSEEVAPKEIIEADIEAMTADIDDPLTRARMQETMKQMYKTFGLFHG
ncbi:MAG: hypothetical protein Q8L37_06990 [Candidatus Gottesmanbacteria bacterium]|nr:hypothetical protein [Candidatus Gottesmanbacteria bacterium]